MADYKKLFSFNLFTNEKEPNSNRPDLSNSKVVFDHDVYIKAGDVVSVGGWKTDRGQSIKFEMRLDDSIPAQPEGGGIGNFDDI